MGLRQQLKCEALKPTPAKGLCVARAETSFAKDVLDPPPYRRTAVAGYQDTVAMIADQDLIDAFTVCTNQPCKARTLGDRCNISNEKD
jgi:hypothetical protein